jgi:peptidoglycan/LPS O-acetylase OafA/YrhL
VLQKDCWERSLSSATFSGVKKIGPLTSIRFFLAFQVAVRHTLGTFMPGVEATAAAGTLRGFLWREIVAPSFAVSFFFLLSGYVLALVYLRDGQGVSKGRFFAARFARVYPLYLVTLLWDTPGLFANRLARLGWASALGKTAATFAAHLVMLQAWYPTRLSGLDDPNWSLSAETFFYLCFPVLGIALWRLRGAKVWIAAICLYVGGQIAVWLVQPHLQTETVMFSPMLHLSTFVLGVLLARWRALRAERSQAEPVRGWQANAVLGASLAALLVVNRFPVRLPAYDFCFTGLLAPILMGIIWALSSAQTLAARMLSTRWLVVLDESSYALYLIHIPMFHMFKFLRLETHLAVYPVYLALCVGLSVLSFYYLETPARRWLLERFHVRSRESAVAASSAQ